MVTRADVVAEGRKWVKTPFKHQARVLRRGVDCVGLVLCIAEDLKLLDTHGKPFGRFDYTDYSAQPDHNQVQLICIDRLVRIPAQNMQAGDIINIRMPNSPCHVGLLTSVGGKDYILHAYNTGRKDAQVVEHILDKSWRHRIVAAFQFPGVN